MDKQPDKKKKKNPPDLTVRNIRAVNKRFADLEKRIKKLEEAVERGEHTE